MECCFLSFSWNRPWLTHHKDCTVRTLVMMLSPVHTSFPERKQLEKLSEMCSISQEASESYQDNLVTKIWGDRISARKENAEMKLVLGTIFSFLAPADSWAGESLEAEKVIESDTEGAEELCRPFGARPPPTGAGGGQRWHSRPIRDPGEYTTSYTHGGQAKPQQTSPQNETGTQVLTAQFLYWAQKAGLKYAKASYLCWKMTPSKEGIHP